MPSVLVEWHLPLATSGANTHERTFLSRSCGFRAAVCLAIIDEHEINHEDNIPQVSCRCEGMG